MIFYFVVTFIYCMTKVNKRNALEVLITEVGKQVDKKVKTVRLDKVVKIMKSMMNQHNVQVLLKS